MTDASNTIAADKVVSLKFVLTTDDGQEFERSAEGEPLVYLHGHQNIVPGLEEALVGKTVGDVLDVSVPPEKGYGFPQGKPVKLPRSRFPADVKVEAGSQFFTQTEKGEQVPVWVTKVMGSMVTISTSHPLAGKTLNFHVEVLEIREPSAEELQHGHVHGAHGHHHDEDDGHGHDHDHDHDHGHSHD